MTVGGASNGHAPCRILSLQQRLFCVSGISWRSYDYHRVEVNLATPSCGDITGFEIVVSMDVTKRICNSGVAGSFLLVRIFQCLFSGKMMDVETWLLLSNFHVDNGCKLWHLWVWLLTASLTQRQMYFNLSSIQCFSEKLHIYVYVLCFIGSGNSEDKLKSNTKCSLTYVKRFPVAVSAPVAGGPSWSCGAFGRSWPVEEYNVEETDCCGIHSPVGASLIEVPNGESPTVLNSYIPGRLDHAKNNCKPMLSVAN